MRKTLKQKIDESLLEMDELKKRHDQLLAQYKAQEDKARTHRLCRRGGYVEKHLPELIALTDDQFYAYVEKALLSNFSRRIIAELSAGGEASAAPQGGSGGVQTSAVPSQKPAGAAQGGGTAAGGVGRNNVVTTS